MNNGTGGSRARWRRCSGRARALTAVAGLAVLTAACGGGGTSAGSGASPSAISTYAKALTYAQCMRSHGVPNFPDPSSNGAFNGSSLNLQSAQAQSAENACKSLQPTSLGPSGQGQGQDTTQKLRFAQCMRTHGVPNYPDPSSDGVFHIPKGTDTQTGAYRNAEKACQSIMSGPGQQSGGGA